MAWICEKCGGIFRGVKRAEVLNDYTLDEEGNLMEFLKSELEDSDFEKYYCFRCGEEAEDFSDLKKIAEWKE